MIRAPEAAMVLAAGLGTRMRPLTDSTPKPLIKVAGKALIDYTLDRFASAGVRRAVVNVHYLADQIEKHLATREAPEISISDERSLLLETGGGFRKAIDLLGPGAVFCTNTDAIICDGPGPEACARLADEWAKGAADAVLLLARRDRASGYDGAGDFECDARGALSWRRGETTPFVFTGLQIITPALLEGAPPGAFSMRVLWEKAMASGRLIGVVHDGDWLHVGDSLGLAAAEARLSTGAAQ